MIRIDSQYLEVSDRGLLSSRREVVPDGGKASRSYFAGVLRERPMDARRLARIVILRLAATNNSRMRDCNTGFMSFIRPNDPFICGVSLCHVARPCKELLMYSSSRPS